MSEARVPQNINAVESVDSAPRESRGPVRASRSARAIVPEDAQEIIAALESEVDELSRRLETLERSVESMRAMGEEFWRKEAALYLLGLNATSWAYDVRDPNVLFSDLFQVEVLADGVAQRWVGRSGELAATVAVNRAAPLIFTVDTVFFSAPQLAKTLKLEIDGDEVAWLAHDGKRWSANVPSNPVEARLCFRLSVDQSLIPEGKTVSFSISQIHVEPLSSSKTSRADNPTIAPPRSSDDAAQMKGG